MTRSGPTVRERVIRCLRGSPVPLGTGQLAARCAGENPRASAVTLTVLLKLEAVGVVVRLPPVIRGPGRPAWRWVLRVRG